MTRPRPPFRMLPNRWAQARYTVVDRGVERQVLKSGRASYVWLHGVLVPLACRITDRVEIRRDHSSPWHAVTGSEDAYAQIMAHYPMQRGLKRMVERRRSDLTRLA